MSPAPLALPTSPDPEVWADFVFDRSDSCVDAASQLVAQLTDGTTRTPADVLSMCNDVAINMLNAGSLNLLMRHVHPDEEVRSTAAGAEEEVALVLMDFALDADLFTVIADVDAAALDEQESRLLRDMLRDFRRSGVDKPEAVREELHNLTERITTLEQDFARNIADDVRSIRVAGDRLAGLPQDFLDSHPAEPDGLVTLTTAYPDAFPVRKFAHDAGVRRALAVEFGNRAWPANDRVLDELLRLRGKRARLLGYADWPSYDAEIKMIGSGAAIPEFIDQIAAIAEPAARRDLEILLRRRQADDPSATSLSSADLDYYSELVRRETFDVDANEVRRYLDFEVVRAGVLAVTGRLFGIEYRPVPDAPSWHPDVAVYDVYATDDSGDRLGRIYLDLQPRAGKYSHAAQFDLVPGIAGRQLPEGALVCNFSSGLMEHSDVVVLFHEFGHLVHHILAGRQKWARFSGVATETDFVEAPAQLLEEWAWDAEVLRSFAVDSAGVPIPSDLVDRMRIARGFAVALSARTQMSRAALSYWLHVQCPDDITGTAQGLQSRYDLLDGVAGTHAHASFTHLGSYTSGHYTYAWSRVIARDMFSGFDAGDLLDQNAAHRYRDDVLCPGGSEDAATLVSKFLGRPYSLDAFTRWLSDLS